MFDEINNTANQEDDGQESKQAANPIKLIWIRVVFLCQIE